MAKKTLADIQAMKTRGERIAMMTAYDHPFAALLDEAGMDIILAGDSLANVVLGLVSTREIGTSEMVHHARAVSRAVKQAVVVADLPYSVCSSEAVSSGSEPLSAARQLMAAGCDAVKLEWSTVCLQALARLRADGIPVMGHIGLTPQTADRDGGFTVRGRTAQAADMLYRQALDLEAAGCFALVLECVPDRVAGFIAGRVMIPVIGIGAGPDCDGQVLVMHDAAGLSQGHRPKFVKVFCDVSAVFSQGAGDYIREVKDRVFPDPSRAYTIDEQEFQRFLEQAGPGGNGSGRAAS